MQSPSQFTSATLASVRQIHPIYISTFANLTLGRRHEAKETFDFRLCEQQQFILTKYKTRKGELEPITM
jgi:hypothetical protein